MNIPGIGAVFARDSFTDINILCVNIMQTIDSATCGKICTLKILD